MSQKRVKLFQMESLRLSMNERMASVREDISCVVNERLSSVEQFMFSLFQREIETLETLLERQDKLLDVILQPHVKLHRADQCVETSLQVKMSSPQPSWTVSVKLEPEDHLDTNFLHLSVYKEEVSPEQQERSPSLVQEEPEAPHIKEEQEDLLQRPEEADGSTLTLLAVKSEGDDENIDTEPVASTSTEYMKTADVEDCGTSQQTCNDLSSHHSESDITEDSDEWEEETRVVNQTALKTLKSHVTQHVKGDRNTDDDDDSKDVESSKQPHSIRRDTGKKGKMFSKKIHLKKHMMTHAGEKPFTCTVCGKGCVYRCQLKIHMMTHTGERPFTCTVCGKGCVLRSNLKIHMMTHTGEKPFTCTICGKGCVNTSNLKSHMKTHTGELPFTCTVCGKGFSQMTNLKMHMIRTNNLKQHMMTHMVEKPHTEKPFCTVCGKGCFNLKSHMMTHTGEWAFNCTVCGKGFSQINNLKIHMRIHTGEKPFMCTVCGKGFAQTNNLKIHMRIHTGEKPFMCTVCGKGFAQKNNLKTHMRLHVGEKPFMCTVCGKGFSQKNNLKTHMRIHAGEKPFTVCGDN